MAISNDIQSLGMRILIIPALVVSAAVVVPATFGTVGTAAPEGLPACNIAERPARADGYDQWSATLLDPAHTLGMSYIPPDLRHGAIRGQEVTVREFVVEPLTEMLDAAARDGVTIRITSSYRSYADQRALLASNPDEDDLIALPGHSEHQLGTTVDLAGGDEWLTHNAPRFGFVMSFPEARSPAFTCYRPEPWHYRYFGPDLATAIAVSGLSPREYLWQSQ